MAATVRPTSSFALLPNTRAALVRRGLWLALVTAVLGATTAAIALAIAGGTGSTATTVFGLNAIVEAAIGAAALWRLGIDSDPGARLRLEARSRGAMVVASVALTLYAAGDAVRALAMHDAARIDLGGIALAVAAMIVLRPLSDAKRRVGKKLGNATLLAESQRGARGGQLAAVLAIGLLLHHVDGWWWADPCAALAMVPLLAREAADAARARQATR